MCGSSFCRPFCTATLNRVSPRRKCKEPGRLRLSPLFFISQFLEPLHERDFFGAISDSDTSRNTTACSPSCVPANSCKHTSRHTAQRGDEDSAAHSSKAEYDRGLWRYWLLSTSRLENAGTPIGGVPLRRCSPCLLNLKCGSDNCSSRQGCIPRQRSCAPGASKTGTGSMSQNGYLRNGASPWI